MESVVHCPRRCNLLFLFDSIFRLNDNISDPLCCHSGFRFNAWHWSHINYWYSFLGVSPIGSLHSRDGWLFDTRRRRPSWRLHAFYPTGYSLRTRDRNGWSVRKEKQINTRLWIFTIGYQRTNVSHTRHSPLLCPYNLIIKNLPRFVPFRSPKDWFPPLYWKFIDFDKK